MARWAGEPTFSGQLDLITHHRLTVWPHSPVTSPHHLHSMYQTVHRDLQISVLSCSTASLIAAGHNALSFTCCVQWTDYSMVCVYNTINTTAHSYQHTQQPVVKSPVLALMQTLSRQPPHAPGTLRLLRSRLTSDSHPRHRWLERHWRSMQPHTEHTVQHRIIKNNNKEVHAE